MKYLHLFKTKQEHNTAYQRGGGYKEPWVAYTEETKNVSYNMPPPPHDYSQDYLTFEALESGTFKFTKNAIYYSVDYGETWVELPSNTNTPTVNAGEKIMFKANLSAQTTNYPFGCGIFSSTANFNAMGNPYSLLNDSEFTNITDLTGINYAAHSLFDGCIKLISAENLSLPATTLTYNCYSGMFRGCASLTAAPELPATTLASNCYGGNLQMGNNFGMFEGCTSLAAAPKLPATVLADYCYNGMFSGCTSLTAAPEILATTLAVSCCYGMFIGCTDLTTAPELYATTLTTNCYHSMFSGCTSLNYIKAMFTTEPSTTYTTNWVSGVASTGTFVKNSAANWTTTGVNGIPTGWSVETASA